MSQDLTIYIKIEKKGTPKRKAETFKSLGYLSPDRAFVNLPGEAFQFDGFLSKETLCRLVFQPLSSGLIFWLLEFVFDEINSWLHPFPMIPI